MRSSSSGSSQVISVIVALECRVVVVGVIPLVVSLAINDRYVQQQDDCARLRQYACTTREEPVQQLRVAAIHSCEVVY